MALESPYSCFVTPKSRAKLIQIYTVEKTFIHGRFLKPTTAISHSRDQRTKDSRRPKRVTFFCLPFFSIDRLKSYTTDKRHSGHPLRSLMQTVYRLESTRQRDSNQILNTACNGDAVHVPELWALMIGKRKKKTAYTFFKMWHSIDYPLVTLCRLFADSKFVGLQRPSQTDHH